MILNPVKMEFLKYRGTIKTGKGDIAADIESASIMFPKTISAS
jgi:hypothetical protein